MRRVAVLGCSGSGKTTAARAIAERLNLVHIELDALSHQANWTPTPPDEFQASLVSAMDEAEASHGGWTVCGGYDSVIDPIRLPRADTIVWLDLPRPVVMRQSIGRTIRRAVTREELWNGNREPLTNFYRWDPEKNVIRWAWTTFDDKRQRNIDHIANGDWDHADVHRLCSRREVDAFVASLGSVDSLG